MGSIIGTFGSSAAAASSARIAATDVPTGTRLSLTTDQIAHARSHLEKHAMPADHLEKVVFVKGMKGHGWIVERALKNGNPAITRGNVVYVRDDFWAAATNPNRETFWSEIAHTSQYQLGNFESHYISGVIGSILIGGDGHDKNIMEVIAHKRLGEPMAIAWAKAHP